jgi:hypothetical protein
MGPSPPCLSRALSLSPGKLVPSSSVAWCFLLCILSAYSLPTGASSVRFRRFLSAVRVLFLFHCFLFWFSWLCLLAFCFLPLCREILFVFSFSFVTSFLCRLYRGLITTQCHNLLLLLGHLILVSFLLSWGHTFLHGSRRLLVSRAMATRPGFADISTIIARVSSNSCSRSSL